MCVQRFDDSLNSAIHITYRISLRSSSMPEPRDPLLKVLLQFFSCLWFRRFVGQLFGKESSGGRLCGLDPRARGQGKKFADRSPPKQQCGFTRVCDEREVSHPVREGFQASLMILPQVHLRKPCYDFYFL